jgi:hypothetical protein
MISSPPISFLYHDGTSNIAIYAARQSVDGSWKNGAQFQQGEGSTNLVVLRLNKHFSVGEEGKYTIAPLIGSLCCRNTCQRDIGTPARPRRIGIW